MTEDCTPEPAKFRDFDSTGPEWGRATLCVLYTDGGYGVYLGQVYITSNRWIWEADDFVAMPDPDDEDATPEGEGWGICETRREAKAALRAWLRENGQLPARRKKEMKS